MPGCGHAADRRARGVAAPVLGDRYPRCPKGQLCACARAGRIGCMSEDGTKGVQQLQAKRLVAIVDDDTSVRQSTCRLIRSFGYRAEGFASGAEFLSSALAEKVECLLLDVRMPDMDGLEVQRLLAERGARIPI